MSRRLRLDFERIDRKLAAAFLAVAGGLVVAVVLLGAVLYTRILRSEQQRLASVVASVLKPSLESVRATGTFRLQNLAARLRRENPQIVYLRVSDADGLVLQEGPEPEGAGPSDAPRDRRGVSVRQTRVAGSEVLEIVDSLHGGYEGSWVGTVRIGVRSEPLTRTGARAVGILGAVLLGLLAASWPLMRRLSRRLGGPVQTLARDFAGVMEHAPLHVAIEDASGAIDRASEAFQRAFGVRPEDAPPTRALLPDGALDHLEERPEIAVRLQGEERLLHLARFPVLLGPQGQVLRSALVGTDVTTWRRDQAERDRLAAAVESSADALLVVEPGRGVVYANPALFARTGFSRDEVLQRDPAGFLPADEAGRAALSALGPEATWGGLIAARRSAGPPWQCDLRVSPIASPDGRVRAQVWVGRDVTREAELEGQLRQSQKLEAVGLLAGGIAHDFNNLLTVALSAAELLAMEPLTREQAQHVSAISTAGRRAADLTRQLLAFSRQQRLTIRPLSLNEVVSGALSLLRRGLGPTVELSFTAEPALWTMRGDAGQLEQVLLNLALNARDAMPGGGTLKVRTANVSLRGSSPTADGAPVPDGDYVELSVCDTGTGIAPSVMEHIFEPFFSTKAAGKGTGLGLPMVLGIVKQCEGHVFVESAPGAGTTFRLAFPRSEAAGAAQEKGARAQESSGRGEHIVLVDDEPMVRNVLSAILSRAGYRVRVAENGEDALRLLSEAPLPDLVVSDLLMPKMGGRELARVLSGRHPQLPLLFLSGYIEDPHPTAGLPGVECLWKPVNAADLLAAVERALRRGKASAAG